MIFDSIKNASRYPFPERLKKALDYIASHDLSVLPLGRTEIDGGDIYVNVMEKDVTGEGIVYESHERFADIHVVIEGVEVFRMIDKRYVKATTDFNEADDYTLFEKTSGEPTTVVVHPGEFVVQYPEEIHLPNNVLQSGPTHLKKAVAKVRMA